MKEESIRAHEGVDVLADELLLGVAGQFLARAIDKVDFALRM